MAKQRGKAALQRKTSPAQKRTKASVSLLLEGWQRKANWFVALISALSLLLLALPYLGGVNDPMLGSLVVLVLLGAGAGGVTFALWRRQSLSLSLAEVFLIAFVAWQWLSVLFSVYQWASLREASQWTAFAVLVMFLQRWSADERWALAFAAAFVAGATIAALQGLSDYALNAALGNFAWRIFGPFLQPNLFGNYLLVAFFFALAIAFARPRKMLFLPAFVALLLLIAMALTGSKGALLAWLLGVAVFGGVALWQIAAHWQQRRWLVLAGLFAGALVVLLIFVTLPPIRSRFETLFTAQAHSWIFRLFVWKATLQGAVVKPLTGFGAGTFEWAYPQFTVVGFTRHAHNGFLQVAIESGFVGLGLLLAFLVSVVWTIAQSCSEAPTMRRWLCLGSLAAVVAFCFHNLMETAWMTPANLLAFATAIGIGTNSAKNRFAFSPRWQLLLFLPLAVGIWHSLAVVRGSHFARLAREEPLPSSRLYWLEQANTADPLNARLLLDRVLLLEAWATATGDRERLKEALQLCERVVRLQPTRSGNYKVKARLLRALGDEEGAEQALRTALSFSPMETEVMLRLGELLEARGQLDEAEQWYRRLVALDNTPYVRYKPIEQWQDIYIAAGKVRLAKRLLARRQSQETQLLLTQAQETLRLFRDHYLPIIKASDPEAAAAQEAFVNSLEAEMEGLKR